MHHNFFDCSYWEKKPSEFCWRLILFCLFNLILTIEPEAITGISLKSCLEYFKEVIIGKASWISSKMSKVFLLMRRFSRKERYSMILLAFTIGGFFPFPFINKRASSSFWNRYRCSSLCNIFLRDVFDQVGLTNLSCPVDDKRFPSHFVPFDDFLSIYSAPLLRRF